MLRVNASIGISLFPEHGHEVSTLLRRADIAMYQAKTIRVGYYVYTPATDSLHEQNRLRTLEELRSAIFGRTIEVHYQPKLNASTLARHRGRGLGSLAAPDPADRHRTVPPTWANLFVPRRISRPVVKNRSSAVDHQVMDLRPFTALTTNNWVDLHLAAEYAGVAGDVLLQAVTTRGMRAITSHPDRPGDWMVQLADVDLWLRRRQSVAIVLG